MNNKFINVRKSKGYQYLRQYLSQQGMPDSFI
nr:MAG TPA: RecX family [Caudoviricetes sp.]